MGVDGRQPAGGSAGRQRCLTPAPAAFPRLSESTGVLMLGEFGSGSPFLTNMRLGVAFLLKITAGKAARNARCHTVATASCVLPTWLHRGSRGSCHPACRICDVPNLGIPAPPSCAPSPTPSLRRALGGSHLHILPGVHHHAAPGGLRGATRRWGARWTSPEGPVAVAARQDHRVIRMRRRKRPLLPFCARAGATTHRFVAPLGHGNLPQWVYLRPEKRGPVLLLPGLHSRYRQLPLPPPPPPPLLCFCVLQLPAALAPDSSFGPSSSQGQAWWAQPHPVQTGPLLVAGRATGNTPTPLLPSPAQSCWQTTSPSWPCWALRFHRVRRLRLPGRHAEACCESPTSQPGMPSACTSPRMPRRPAMAWQAAQATEAALDVAPLQHALLALARTRLW